MKKIILILALFFTLDSLYSQNEPTADMTTNNQPAIERTYPISLGIESGINYTGFFALSAEGNIAKNLCINGDFGLGGWGFKLGISARYYKSYPKGLYYSLGFFHSTGIDSIEISLATTNSPNNAEEIALRFEPVNNLNLGLGYQWQLGNRFRLHIELGYSIILKPEPWEVLTPNKTLTQTSKQVMNFSAPGGLMFGLGFSVGLY